MEEDSMVVVIGTDWEFLGCPTEVYTVTSINIAYSNIFKYFLQEIGVLNQNADPY
jgi:hypothetical protein